MWSDPKICTTNIGKSVQGNHQEKKKVKKKKVVKKYLNISLLRRNITRDVRNRKTRKN